MSNTATDTAPLLETRALSVTYGTPAGPVGWYGLACVVLGAIGFAGSVAVAATAFTRGRS